MLAMESWRRARRRGGRYGVAAAWGRVPSLSLLPSKRKQDAFDAPINRSRKRARRGSDRNLDSTVFVGDLSTATSSSQLKSFFENYGEVTKAKVVFEQGYGFVTFEAREIAEGVVVAAAGKEGILMGNRKIRVSWALGSVPEWNTGVGVSRTQSNFKKRYRHQGPPRRCRSRLFLSAVASAVASATAEAVIQGNGPGPTVEKVCLPSREVIAYDDWL